MNDNNLGNRIADLLKQRGMTQRELAVKAGITEKSMAGIVSGERTPMGPTVANIANALHTTPGYLLGKEEKKEEEMTGLTTKEQERKAIQKIRKIVKELGENSYVGFAMDGVLELAEKNIRDDTAYSMKKRAEIAWERADKAEKENKNLKAEVEDLKKTVKKRRTTISELNTELCNARAKAKANEVPEELIQEMYCMAYDNEDVDRMMDIESADKKFNMRLDEWLNADDFNFAHDFYGIVNNINREKGFPATDFGFFVPRFTGR